MSLQNDVLQLEYLAAARTRFAYQGKVRTGEFQIPSFADLLNKAYILSYHQWLPNQPMNNDQLKVLLAVFEEEAVKHFSSVPDGPLKKPRGADKRDWAQARVGPIATLANQSDAFIRYWVNSFGNRGTLAAGFAGGFNKKVWVAMNDVYTSDYCNWLDKQVKNLDETYSYANFTGLAPPAHFVAAA
jgi:hypothetical protein